jgi:multimeric flavodoxin WrbA
VTAKGTEQRRILVLCGSPRVDGNSRALADALVEGARGRGHAAEVVQLGEVMTGMLRDCRRCRLADGRCAIEDSYEQLIHEQVIPADALVYATPLYWYGMAATMKNFFDRLVCYISASYPRQAEVVEGLKGKRIALLLASEERYPSAGIAVVGNIQEVSRYLHQQFVEVVNGIGNKRGEVRFDPADPLAAARALGRNMFDLHHSDYDIDAARPNAVWAQARETNYDASLSPYADV